MLRFATIAITEAKTYNETHGTSPSPFYSKIHIVYIRFLYHLFYMEMVPLTYKITAITYLHTVVEESYASQKII